MVLPKGFQIVEDPDIVALRCDICGWKAEYSAAGALFENMVFDAEGHHCPRPHAVPERLAILSR
jgi:hypothetical protein